MLEKKIYHILQLQERRTHKEVLSKKTNKRRLLKLTKYLNLANSMMDCLHLILIHYVHMVSSIFNDCEWIIQSHHKH